MTSSTPAFFSCAPHSRPAKPPPSTATSISVSMIGSRSTNGVCGSTSANQANSSGGLDVLLGAFTAKALVALDRGTSPAAHRCRRRRVSALGRSRFQPSSCVGVPPAVPLRATVPPSRARRAAPRPRTAWCSRRRLVRHGAELRDDGDLGERAGFLGGLELLEDHVRASRSAGSTRDIRASSWCHPSAGRPPTTRARAVAVASRAA